MQKSLKYLNKTGDSFFDGSADRKFSNPPKYWLEIGASKSASQQLIAIRQFEPSEDSAITQQQSDLLLEKLRSAEPAILLQSVATVEQLGITDDAVVAELRMLIESRDQKVLAKSMCALTRLKKVDDETVKIAGRLLDANANYVVFSGIFALSSLESLPEPLMPAVDRGFKRALQWCNYEFIGLYIQCYSRWLPDPGAHFEAVLKEDSPEYLEIAIESLEKFRQQMIELKRA